MGVASIGVAALKLKRKFVGIELIEEYFRASENRLMTLQ
jgi:DNA modification methylase